MDIENKGKQYKSDSVMVYSCQYHVVFAPKYRRHILNPPIDERLKQLILEKAHELNCDVLDMEVMPDHVHLLLDVNPKIGIYDVVTAIKGFSAHMLRSEFPWLKTKLPCLWTRSKFISTVGTVSLDVVKRYIEGQKRK